MSDKLIRKGIPEIMLHSIEGEPYAVKLPRPTIGMASKFIFGIAKGGSTLLEKMMHDVCLATALPTITIPNDAYQAGVRFTNIGPEAEKALFHEGYVYLGFRGFFNFTPRFDFSPHRKVLLMRDPRDMLVSSYFSITKSHVVPAAGSANEHYRNNMNRALNEGLEQFALSKAAQYVRSSMKFRHIEDANLKTYRYEDIIFDKENWLSDMLNHLEISLPQQQISDIARRHDQRPQQEDETQHVRRVTPGDHKEKLSASCIAALNEKLAPMLEKYGYER